MTEAALYCRRGLHRRNWSETAQRRCPDCALDDARAEIVAALRAASPDLTTALARAGVEAALKPPYVAVRVAREIRERPDLLTSGSSASSPALAALLRSVVASGANGLREPACAGCGRAVPLRHHDGPGRKICGACEVRRSTGVCELCGRTDTVRVSAASGQRRCRLCWRRNERPRERCARCGRVREVTSRTDEGSLCQTCWRAARGTSTCPGCGRERALKYRDAEGRLVCSGCYEQPPQRCSHCGEDRRLLSSASSALGPLCERCYVPLRKCGLCRDAGRECPREALWLERREGKPPPRRPDRECARCGRLRPAQAVWPDGPVCSTCYGIGLGAKALCESCGHLRRPWRVDGRSLCADCAGRPPQSVCGRCGDEALLYRRGVCAPCHVREALLHALGASDRDGVPQQLQGVFDALSAATVPRSTVAWLRDSDGFRLLRALADPASGYPLTHEGLDRWERAKPREFLRAVLVEHGALPERDEALARLAAWMEARLAELPDGEAVVLRPFMTWRLLRRVRRTSDRRGWAKLGEVNTAKARSTAAIRFLEWCRERDIHLAGLRAADIEAWLVESASTAYDVRHFLRWTAERGFTPRFRLPARGRLSPAPAIDGERHRATARAIVAGDDDAPARFAAALVYLFGQPLTKIAGMRVDDVSLTGVRATIRLGREQVALPARLSALARDVVAQRRGHTSLAQLGDSEWLFPGATPGRPLTAGSLKIRIDRLGVESVRIAKTAAGYELGSRIPAVALADLLGIHINTAVRWVSATSSNYSGYVATRLAEDEARRRSRSRSTTASRPRTRPSRRP